MKILLNILLALLLLVSCGEATQETAEAQNSVVKQNILPTKLSAKDSIPKNTNMDLLEEDFSIEYIMGQFDPTTHKDFVEISTQYAESKGMYLRKDTYEAFKKMYAAAQKAGHKMVIRSATRPFNHQKRIWEGKWNGNRLVDGKNLSKTIKKPLPRALKILEYSSMPSTSRHHWGTDFDINDFENEYFESGDGKKLYDWLLQHAASYGFCQPYTAKGQNRPEGYFEEKWHWSYLPVATPLTRQAKEKLTDDMIKGFKGSEMAKEIEVVRKYILGINQECL